MIGHLARMIDSNVNEWLTHRNAHPPTADPIKSIAADPGTIPTGAELRYYYVDHKGHHTVTILITESHER